MGDMIKFVDVTKCDGCRGCMVACKNWNDLPMEIEAFQGIQSHKELTANTWNNVIFKEVTGKDGKVDWLFGHMSCHHCKDAACEKVCPEGAITHTSHGSVIINEDKCVGCGICVQNCPFNVIQLKVLEKGLINKRKSSKCNLCYSRLEQGLEPACVNTCLTNSITFGDRDNILSNAKERLKEVKKTYPNANIYDPPGVGGTQTVYLLADKPSIYGLPEDPKVPLSAVVWKDVVEPVGKLMVGATVMGVVGGFVANKLFSNSSNHPTDVGGENNEI